MATRSFKFKQGLFNVVTGSSGSVDVTCAHPDSNSNPLVIRCDGVDYNLASGSQWAKVNGGSGSVTMSGTMPTCTISVSGFDFSAWGDITVTASGATTCAGDGFTMVYFTGTVEFSDPELPDEANDFEIGNALNASTPWKS